MVAATDGFGSRLVPAVNGPYELCALTRYQTHASIGRVWLSLPLVTPAEALKQIDSSV